MNSFGQHSQPRMIIVSGMPASGKSTLAEQVATELSIPLFTKDAIKEILFDAGGYTTDIMDESTSERLGTQAMALLYDSAARVLEAKKSVMVEANFLSDLAAEQLAPFLPRADVRQLYCQLPIDQVVQRFEERQDDDQRHPVHAAIDDTDQLVRDLERKDYGPIDLDIPTLTIDTRSGLQPSLEEILRFCREEREHITAESR